MSDFIYISCPVTARPVSTGFRAPKGSNIANLRNLTLQNCPACGKDHAWSGAMGFWDNETPPSSLWEEVRQIWRGR